MRNALVPLLPVLRRSAALVARQEQSPVAYVKRSSSSGFSGSLLGSGTNQESQLRTYGTIPAVYACVAELAEATAQVEWQLYRKAASGNPDDRTPVSEHAAIDLWEQPNQYMDRQFFTEFVQMHLDLAGESFIVIGTNSQAGALPLSLWPVIPTMMEPVTDAQTFLRGYVYTDPDGVKVPFLPDEVIHLKYPDPLNPYKGLSPVAALLPDLDADRFATEYNRNFFLNSAEPGGIIEMEDAISDDEFTELRDRWDEQHRGTGNSHRVAILTNGMKWVDRSYSMRDLQFSELRNASDQRIMLGFRMGKTLLGQTENVNRATAEAAEYVFGKYRVVRRLNRFKQMWNRILLPRFVGGESLVWDYENPITANITEEAVERDSKVSAAIQLIDRGFEPLDVFDYLGMPPLELAALPEPDPMLTLPALPAAPETGDKLSVKEKAEIVQKVYLGVGPVITWEEARALLREAGMDLPNIPPPEAPAAPAPPDPNDPDEGEPDEQTDEPTPDEGDDEEQALTSAAQAAMRMLLPAPPPIPSARSCEHAHDLARLVPVRPRNAGDPPEQLSPEQLPDISELQAKYDEVLARLLDEIAVGEDEQKRDLVQQVFEAASSGSIEDLAALSVDTSAVSAAIGVAMIEVGDHAAAHVVKEAAEQGVTITAREADPALVDDVAIVVASQLAARLIGSAAASAMRANSATATATQVADFVEEQLAALSTDSPKTIAGGALTGTQNEARIETFRKAPEGALYANEINDSNTCEPCRAINGKWLGNISDIDQVCELYPGGAYGGYIKCQGRERCRGTITGVWRRSFSDS